MRNDLRTLWLYKIFGLSGDIITIFAKVFAFFTGLYLIVYFVLVSDYYKHNNEALTNYLFGITAATKFVVLVTVMLLLLIIKKKSHKLLSVLYLDSDVDINHLLNQWKVYDLKLAWLSYILRDTNLLILAMLKPSDKIDNIKRRLKESLKDKCTEDCLCYKDLKIVWLYKMFTLGTMYFPILIVQAIGLVIIAVLILAITNNNAIPWLKLLPWIILLTVAISTIAFIMNIKVKRVLLNYTDPHQLDLTTIINNITDTYMKDTDIYKLSKIKNDPALKILSYIPDESPLAEIQKQKIREEFQS